MVHFPINDKLPDRASLIQITGVLSSVQRKDKNIQMYFLDEQKPYDYPKKFGAYDEVLVSLKASENAQIKILINSDIGLPRARSNVAIQKIFEISRNNDSIQIG
ncbi:hypothetical protein OE749_09495 [Aestuariibacter sp. AA17]|uniref:Uncharacterized protein n=1 Tax=Fluctibacter corallii TaxID=2984329 RepID=A0ABT3A8E7_9ALTE|nr:hypothetical protein [Aestuariibacter sp. AA17]MCV2884929.1 hypothetical protein [Aestuariibacter sp. AA17]